MAKLTNWDRFVLLLWKNWILQWNHRVRTVVELVLPFSFIWLIVLMRVNLSTFEESLEVYEETDVTPPYDMP